MFDIDRKLGTVAARTELTNAGRRTAYNVHVFAFLAGVEKDAPASTKVERLKYVEAEARGSGTMAPGATMMNETDPMLRRLIKSTMAAGNRVYYVGEVWWEDEQHEKHSNPFCFELRKDGLFESRKAKTCEQ